MFNRRTLLALPFFSPLAVYGQAAINVASPLGERALGDEKAPITLIEYASLTCGYCAQFHANTYPKLKKDYIETGKVRFILREFARDPLDSAAYMLARCAPQDKYFDVIGVFFATQSTWTAASDPLAALLAIAKQVGFTKETFESCLANQTILDGVNAVRAQAIKLGVESTPTLFINGKKHAGGFSIEELEKTFAPLLK